MPEYLYRRSDGTEFTEFQWMNDDPLEVCPETGLDCKRIITGGHGPLLPRAKTVKYRDGKFINTKLAKKLEKSPFYTSLKDKREKIQKKTEENKQKNAEMRRKVTGRISEL